MFQNPFYKKSIQMAVWVVVAIALTRFTLGVFAVIIALAGIWCALTMRRGLALACFILLPFMLVMNPLILPGSSFLSLSTRFGAVLSSGALMLAAQRSAGREALPLGALFVYLGCAALSSFSGYHPLISYFKIVNFIFFIVCIYFGTRNLQRNPRDVAVVRTFIFALAIIVVFGSLATIAVPSVGYYVSVKKMIVLKGVEEAALFLKSTEGMSLFCGVMNQSQVLAPMLACVAGVVVCDLICVERRAGWLHVGLLSAVPVLLFMTRSRAGFLSFVVLIGMLVFYCLRHVNIPPVLKQKMSRYMMVGIVLIVCAGVFVQVRNKGLSRLLRKTEDVSADHRSLGDAFTGSRQGLIDMSLRDFRRNPFLGKGFQVAEYMWSLEGQAKKSGFVISAPIEKGFLPAMVLGEGGVLGALAFIFFILCFWLGCSKRGLVATWTLFVVYLTTNLAEATFFSPGGMGGILWLITVVGGFVIDLAAKGKVDVARLFAAPPVQNRFANPAASAFYKR